MRKSSFKLTSLILTLVMIASLIVVPVGAQAAELNEITGFIWDVNTITGIKIANSYENATNVQAILAVYEGTELKTVTSKDVNANEKTAAFDAPVTLASGQTAKAFLWNAQNLEPLAKSYPVTDAGIVDSSCQVVGTQKVILPADNATIKSKINYSLYDSDLGTNVNAKFTLTGSDLTGLSITEDGVLTTTPQAKAGTVFVNAQYGCKVYQKELTLVKGYYDNFESYTVGSVPAGHTASLLSVVEETVGGNKYIEKSSGYPRIDFATDLTSDNVTFEYDLKVNKTMSYYNPLSVANGIKASGTTYYVALDCRGSGNQVRLGRGYNSNGESSSYIELAKVDEGWVNIRFVLYCNQNKYDLYINDALVAQGWKVRNDIVTSTLIGYSPNSFVDNVNVYSGTSYDPYVLEGVSTLAAPGDNADFTTSLNYTLKDIDTKSAVSGAKYSLADGYAGFAMAENGELTVSSDAQAGTITVKATVGGTVYTKDVIVKKGYSENFDSFTTGSEPYQNDNKWANRDGVIALKDGSQTDKYLKNAFNANNRYSFGSDIKADTLTFEFDTLYTEENLLNASGGIFSENQFQLNTGYKEDNSVSFYFNYGSRYDKINDIVNIFTYDTNTFVTQVQRGTWIPTRIVVDFTANKYDVYVNNELVAEDVNISSNPDHVRFEVNTIILGKYIDNINIYSGTKTPSTLYLVGDSIVQSYTGSDARPYPIQGWGYYIDDCFGDDIVVDNRARSGWDTDEYLYPDGIYDKENGCQEYGSIIYEADGTTKKTVSQSNYFWENIVNDIKPGDYVMISLGINDNGSNVPQERYRENIETMYNEATAKGATVLFTTPTIHAGSWNSTSAFAENTQWSVYGGICLAFAQSKGAVCLPLGSTLATLYNDMVAEYKLENPSADDKTAYNYVRNSFHIYAVSSHNPPEGIDSFGDTKKDDATHFNTIGANKLAGIIADLIKTSNSSLGRYLK